MAAGVRLRGMQTVWEVRSALIFSGHRMLMAYAERRSGCLALLAAGRMPTVWTINYANLRIGFNALPTLRNSNQFGESNIRFIGIAGIS